MTASVELLAIFPAATPIIFCATPPRLASKPFEPNCRALFWRVPIEIRAELTPVEREDTPVESETIELPTVIRPVESEPTPVDKFTSELLVALKPVDREPTPVDSDAIELFVKTRPVDSEPIPVDR